MTEATGAAALVAEGVVEDLRESRVRRAARQASTFETTPVRRSSSYSVSSRLTTRMSR